MCLLQIGIIYHIVITVLSKGYSDHKILFWVSLVSQLLLMIYYANLRKAQSASSREVTDLEFKIAERAFAGFCFVTPILVIWYNVVIWIR